MRLPEAAAEAGIDAGDPLGCDAAAPFSAFTNLAELNSAAEESYLAMSADELHVVIVSSREGAAKLYSASRPSNPGTFGALRAEAFGSGNGAPQQSALSSDGLTLVVATSAGGALLRVVRADPTTPFSSGSTLATPPEMTNDHLPVGASYTAMGALLVTGTNQAGGPAERSIWEWYPNPESAKLVLAASSTVALTDPVLSADGRTLFYARAEAAGSRAIWRSERPKLGDAFAGPGAAVAELSANADAAPHFLSEDGCRLYFSTSNRPGGKGGRDFWLASRGK